MAGQCARVPKLLYNFFFFLSFLNNLKRRRAVTSTNNYIIVKNYTEYMNEFMT